MTKMFVAIKDWQFNAALMLRSRAVRETVQSKPEIILSGESRTVKWGENVGNINGIWHCRSNLNTLIVLHDRIYNQMLRSFLTSVGMVIFEM